MIPTTLKTRQPRIIGSVASPDQPPFDEAAARRDMEAEAKRLGEQYNAALARVGEPPQRAAFGDRASYERAFTDWAQAKQELDRNFDNSRQAALDAYNEGVRQYNRAQPAQPGTGAQRPREIYSPPWQPAWKPSQQMPEPEPGTTTAELKGMLQKPGGIIGRISRQMLSKLRLLPGKGLGQ